MTKKEFNTENNEKVMQEVRVLNNELTERFHEEYHWLAAVDRPKVTLSKETKQACVLAVKVPVNEVKGIMVQVINDNTICEVGYSSLDDGDIAEIIRKLPE